MEGKKEKDGGGRREHLAVSYPEGLGCQGLKGGLHGVLRILESILAGSDVMGGNYTIRRHQVEWSLLSGET